MTYPDGKALPNDDMPASLLLPMGRTGPAFLAYANFAAYRQEQRGGHVVVRQSLAVRIAHAELRPFRTRQLDCEVGLVPGKIYRCGDAHFLQPGFAATPFQSIGDVVGGRADYVLGAA